MSEVRIDADLARRLVAAQFPRWADLPIRAVANGGWDNRTFHLGEEMAVRLPSAGRYAAQVEKEHRWLPRLAPHLPLPIPVPLAMGVAGEGYPYPWSIRSWLDGETALTGAIADLTRFAGDLAGFLRALQSIDASEGPPAGKHSFFRGGPLAAYDAEARRAIAALDGRIDTAAATEVWETALQAAWDRPPVWIHGDVATGNLLVQDGRLSAVIDFGQLAVGDPACDLAIAWTLFEGESRLAFRTALPLDPGAWARGRGWTLWKALIVLAGKPGANPAERDRYWRDLREVLADHRLFG